MNAMVRDGIRAEKNKNNWKYSKQHLGWEKCLKKNGADGKCVVEGEAFSSCLERNGAFSVAW